MVSAKFELDRLYETLRAREVPSATAQSLVAEAEHKINEILREHAQQIMDRAVESGVDKNSNDFINELVLRPNDGMFVLETETGRTDFSEPPLPMLSKLLAGAKPMKDGSGVYKVIPVGAPSTNRPITSIVDAHKAIAAQRRKDSTQNYAQITRKVVERGAKTNFRTATSKQDPYSKWVLPATEKDFTEEMQSLNQELESTAEQAILAIIQEYEDRYS